MGRKQANPSYRQRQVYFRANPVDDRAFQVMRELETSGYPLSDVVKALIHALDEGSLMIEGPPVRIVSSQRHRQQDSALAQAIVEKLSGPLAQHVSRALATALQGQTLTLERAAANPTTPLISEQEAEKRKQRAFAHDW
jgi:hypothetical protein